MSEEWVGGKGSRQRNVDRQKFEDNYDKIFGRKKVAPDGIYDCEEHDVFMLSEEALDSNRKWREKK